MAKKRFKAELKRSRSGAGGHLVEVPEEVVAALGGKGRIPVRATFNGVPYRGSIVRMGGVWMLGVLKSVMAEANVAPGEVLNAVVELDTEPREVEVPDALARALRKSKEARTAWEKLSYSHRKEYVGYVTEAKKEETRERRVEKAIEALVERARDRARH